MQQFEALHPWCACPDDALEALSPFLGFVCPTWDPRDNSFLVRPICGHTDASLLIEVGSSRRLYIAYTAPLQSVDTTHILTSLGRSALARSQPPDALGTELLRITFGDSPFWVMRSSSISEVFGSKLGPKGSYQFSLRRLTSIRAWTCF